uniref:Predicted protein n=1 Tax=Hordeum vulgare subsp. vulgare TaxID=112509 RepID=F2DJZ3_HORVV|nr:predicted protein [Hordeum vulgare subsp. vulgare]
MSSSHYGCLFRVLAIFVFMGSLTFADECFSPDSRIVPFSKSNSQITGSKNQQIGYSLSNDGKKGFARNDSVEFQTILYDIDYAKGGIGNVGVIGNYNPLFSIFSEDSRYVFFATQDGAQIDIHILNVTSGLVDLLISDNGTLFPNRVMAVDIDMTRIALLKGDNNLQFYDIEDLNNCSLLFNINLGQDPLVHDMIFSKYGDIYLIGEQNSAMYVAEIDKETEAMVLSYLGAYSYVPGTRRIGDTIYFVLRATFVTAYPNYIYLITNNSMNGPYSILTPLSFYSVFISKGSNLEGDLIIYANVGNCIAALRSPNVTQYSYGGTCSLIGSFDISNSYNGAIAVNSDYLILDSDFIYLYDLSITRRNISGNVTMFSSKLSYLNYDVNGCTALLTNKNQSTVYAIAISQTTPFLKIFNFNNNGLNLQRELNFSYSPISGTIKARMFLTSNEDRLVIAYSKGATQKSFVYLSLLDQSSKFKPISYVDFEGIFKDEYHDDIFWAYDSSGSVKVYNITDGSARSVSLDFQQPIYLSRHYLIQIKSGRSGNVIYFYHYNSTSYQESPLTSDNVVISFFVDRAALLTDMIFVDQVQQLVYYKNVYNFGVSRIFNVSDPLNVTEHQSLGGRFFENFDHAIASGSNWIATNVMGIDSLYFRYFNEGIFYESAFIGATQTDSNSFSILCNRNNMTAIMATSVGIEMYTCSNKAGNSFCNPTPAIVSPLPEEIPPPINSYTTGIPGYTTNATITSDSIPVVDESQKSNSNLIIIAVVVPIVALIAIIIIIVIIVVIKRRREKDIEGTPTEMNKIESNDSGVKKDAKSRAMEEFLKIKQVEGIKIKNKIGNGKFGEVFLADWEGTIVAAKKLLDTNDILSFQKEANIMQRCAHPHVVSFLGRFSDPSGFQYIIVEFMSSGSLQYVLENGKNTISLQEQIQMMTGVCRGMIYISRQNILHKDLGVRNILCQNLNGEWITKVSDFGLARVVGESTTNSGDNDKFNDSIYSINGGAVIPVRWSAPEVISDRKFSNKSDVWSFGILMIEVMNFAKLPYSDLSNSEVASRIISGTIHKQPQNCPDALWKIIKTTFAFNPDERPTFSQLLEEISSFKSSIVEENTRKANSVDKQKLEDDNEIINYM